MAKKIAVVLEDESKEFTTSTQSSFEAAHDADMICFGIKTLLTSDDFDWGTACDDEDFRSCSSLVYDASDDDDSVSLLSMGEVALRKTKDRYGRIRPEFRGNEEIEQRNLLPPSSISFRRRQCLATEHTLVEL